MWGPPRINPLQQDEVFSVIFFFKNNGDHGKVPVWILKDAGTQRASGISLGMISRFKRLGFIRFMALVGAQTLGLHGDHGGLWGSLQIFRSGR